MSSSISPAASAATIDSALPIEPMWRWSVEQYHAMVRSGVLSEDDPVELLDGWLVVKMPKNPPHCSSTAGTRDALTSVLPVDWSVRSQEPITLSTSEPEPDLVVVRGDRHRYGQRHPGPQDIALVVEVADTSLERDQQLQAATLCPRGDPGVLDRQSCGEPIGSSTASLPAPRTFPTIASGGTSRHPRKSR
jgi:Uma2 family endonuclease